MSGAEFIAAAGLISSMIAIVDGIAQVISAASDQEGLPKAFRQASNKLPLVSDILEATTHNFSADDVSGIEKSVQRVVDDCKGKWIALSDLFDKVIPEGGASRVERYFKRARTLGKGKTVESLMKGMLEDVQLLTTIKIMTTANVEKVIKTATAVQEEKVAKAITDVESWPSSVPDNLFEEGTHPNVIYGDDPYISQGNAIQNNLRDTARQYNSGGGSLTINEANPQKDEAQACLTALFLTDPRDDRAKLVNSKGSRVDGTCEWIKTNVLYQSWLCSRSQLLWMSGGPGKGKTMLSIFLAEELELTVKNSKDTLFLQYFCEDKDNRNTSVAIMRSLIFQLLELRPELFEHILPTFTIQRASLFTSSGFESLWRIFENMIRDPTFRGTLYCVLDGLDECDEVSLLVLLKKFKVLFSADPDGSSAFRLNLMIASRDRPEFITEILSSFPRIRLDFDADNNVNTDIHRFIEVKVNELSANKRYPKRLCSHVKDVFTNRAQGTFLWVGIAAEMLTRYTWSEVEEVLRDHFPPGLEELYARMLLQIRVDRRKTAAKIFLWVALAVRPLTLSELSVVVGAKPSAGCSCDEVMRDQASHCGYFLTIIGGEVSFFHKSAKDYLLRKTCDWNPELEAFRVKEYTGNLEIAQTCFFYLQNGALADGKVSFETRSGSKDDMRLKNFPLLSYAIMHWCEHARCLDRLEDIFDLSIPFYAEKSSVRESWLKSYWPEEEYEELSRSFTLLHLASYFGILPLAENILLKKGLVDKENVLLYLNLRDGQGNTALLCAATNGHPAVVRLLLEKGADTKANDALTYTTLSEMLLVGKQLLCSDY